MSDLANFVLAGVRDKVVEDLKNENEQLNSRNSALSRSLLLHAPSFVRVENSSKTVLARTQQFPDPRRCECCTWFSLKTSTNESLPIQNFHDITVCLGAFQEIPLARSSEIQVQQVTGYCAHTNRAAIQFTDVAFGVTLHITIGPISKEVGKTVFARTPRNIKLFCQAIAAVAPEATVQFVCITILNEKAVSLLTTKGELTEEEAKVFLRIPLTETLTETGAEPGQNERGGDEEKDS